MLLAAHASMNALLGLFPQAIFTKSIRTNALNAEHVRMSALPGPSHWQNNYRKERYRFYQRGCVKMANFGAAPQACLNGMPSFLCMLLVLHEKLFKNFSQNI